VTWTCHDRRCAGRWSPAGGRRLVVAGRTATVPRSDPAYERASVAGRGCFECPPGGVTVRQPAVHVAVGRRRPRSGHDATVNEALVLLALVWAVLIVPSAVRSRNASPHVTVGGFERAMDVLRSDGRNDARGSSSGRQVFVPGDAGRIVERPTTRAGDGDRVRHRVEDPVVVRRRVWFMRMLAATGATFLVALIAANGWFWTVFLLSAALTAGYVAVLRRLKLQRDEARRVVRELDLPASIEASDDGGQEPDVALDEAVGAGGASGGGGTVRLRRWDD
jgi:hypothetical protein